MSKEIYPGRMKGLSSFLRWDTMPTLLCVYTRTREMMYLSGGNTKTTPISVWGVCSFNSFSFLPLLYLFFLSFFLSFSNSLTDSAWTEPQKKRNIWEKLLSYCVVPYIPWSVKGVLHYSNPIHVSFNSANCSSLSSFLLSICAKRTLVFVHRTQSVHNTRQSKQCFRVIWLAVELKQAPHPFAKTNRERHLYYF